MRLFGLCFLPLFGACETYYLPVPDLNGDGDAEWLAIPTTADAACRARDSDRTSCIAECDRRYGDPDVRGRCVERCDARDRSCDALPRGEDPRRKAPPRRSEGVPLGY